MKVTIGLTLEQYTGGPDDYVPSVEGYRAGARQVEHQVELPASFATLDPVGIADAVFTATNATVIEDLLAVPGAWTMHCRLYPSDGAELGRPVRIGDTVMVAGRTLACVSDGDVVIGSRWVDVTDGRDALVDYDEV